MTKLIICENPLVISEDMLFEVDSVGTFLYNHFRSWPTSAKLYQDVVSDESEIPLENAEDVERLNTLKGTIWVVIFPKGLAAIGILALVATAALVLWPKSKKSESNTVAKQTEQNRLTSGSVGSPNNSLASRTNSPRLNQRIPDIYGSVRSTPDLLCEPYILYDNNQQVEYSYFCVGRGKYLIEDIRDDETKIMAGSGTQVQVYGPDTSPTIGSAQLTIGQPINDLFISAKRSNSVFGQKLLAPNTYIYASYVKFRYVGPNIIEIDNNQVVNPALEPNVSIDLEDFFQAEDIIILSNTGANTLEGTYLVESVSSNRIVLNNPGAVNANWNSLGVSAYGSGNVYAGTTRVIGPFILENADIVIVNFAAESGIYKDDGKMQIAAAVGFEVTVQKIDDADMNVGSPFVFTTALGGSSSSTNKVAVSYITGFPFAGGRVKISAKRTTDKDYLFVGKVSDKVVWESVYACKSLAGIGYGNVTTIRTKTRANSSPTSAKSSKLNCKATRLIPARQSNGSFINDQPSQKMSDIIFAVTQDTKIGNRSLSEVDITGIVAVETAINAYFGTSLCSQFNHTFDNENLSFEEILNMIGEACFCDIYRQGKTIKAFLEKATSESSILFNHRNKIPGSESRTVNFGLFDEKDGVEIEYFSIKDGTSQLFYLPSNQSAINPEKVTVFGVTNKLQAYFHAHRFRQRQLYQNTSVEFDATQEALLLKLKERILVSDNTRVNTFDGEVISHQGNVLTLSQDFKFQAGKSYSIFLQLPDGTIQVIAISEQIGVPNQVRLFANVTVPLAIDENLYARCTYEIAESSTIRPMAFLIEEKTPKDHFTTTIKAVNYDSRYYSHDTDYINSLVTIDGN